MADREQEQGVPLQLLHKIVNVHGFDVETWKHAGRKPNEVGPALLVAAVRLRSHIAMPDEPIL